MYDKKAAVIRQYFEEGSIKDLIYSNVRYHNHNLLGSEFYQGLLFFCVEFATEELCR